MSDSSNASGFPLRSAADLRDHMRGPMRDVEEGRILIEALEDGVALYCLELPLSARVRLTSNDQGERMMRQGTVRELLLWRGV